MIYVLPTYYAQIDFLDNIDQWSSTGGPQKNLNINYYNVVSL